MNRIFSISIGALGIKSTKEFTSEDLNLLHGIITADYGAIKELTLYIRYECKGNEALQREEKTRLVYSLPTGIFKYRNLNGLMDYSCFACFDIDADLDIPEEAEYLKKVWEQLKGDPLVLMQWHSVREGIKFIVEHDNTDPSLHKDLMKAIVGELDKRGVDMWKIDIDCYDVTRAHYLSYDPGAILNDSSEVFHFKPPIAPKQFTPKPYKQKTLKLEDILGKRPNPASFKDDWARIHAVQKESDERFPVVKGHRNKHLFIFALKLHDLGVSEAIATQYLIIRYSEDDFPASEIIRIIKNAHK